MGARLLVRPVLPGSMFRAFTMLSFITMENLLCHLSPKSANRELSNNKSVPIPKDSLGVSPELNVIFYIVGSFLLSIHKEIGPQTWTWTPLVFPVPFGSTDPSKWIWGPPRVEAAFLSLLSSARLTMFPGSLQAAQMPG